MAVSSFAVAASTDEGGTLIGSVTVTGSGKLACAPTAGSYSFTYYGSGTLTVYSYDSSGNGSILGSISSATPTSGYFVLASSASGFAFSGNGTVIVRKFAASTASTITDYSSTVVSTGAPSTDASGQTFYMAETTAYGAGKFVGVQGNSSYNSTTVAYSSDGKVWSKVAALPVAISSNATNSNIVFMGGVFIILYQNYQIWTSTDGLTWTSRTIQSIGSTSNRKLVAYDGTKYYIFSGNALTNQYQYSSDLVTWTIGTLPASEQWQAVAYGGGRFIITKYVSPTTAYTSTDGINWTSLTLPGQMFSIKHNGTVFLGAHGGGGIGIWSSLDGTTWTSRDIGYAASEVFALNGIFVLRMQTGGFLYHDASGAFNNWSSGQSLVHGNQAYVGVTYGNGTFITTNNSQAIVRVSPASPTTGFPTTWNTTGVSGSDTAERIYYVNGKYIALGTNQYLGYSTDLTNWTSVYSGFSTSMSNVEYINGMYVVINADLVSGSFSNNVYYTSPDLVTWTYRNMPAYTNWRSLARTKDRLIATRGSTTTPGTHYYTTDGINWTNSNTAYGQIAVQAGDILYFLPQSSGTFIYGSTNQGTSAGAITLPSNMVVYDVAYGNGIYLFSTSNAFYKSTNGVDFGTQYNGFPQNPYFATGRTIKFYNGKFYAAGGSDLMSSLDGRVWSVGAGNLTNTLGYVGAGHAGTVAGDSTGNYAKTNPTITIS